MARAGVARAERRMLAPGRKTSIDPGPYDAPSQRELPLDDVGRALLVLVGDREVGAVVELGVHIERRRADADGRSRAVRVAREDRRRAPGR